MVPIKRTLALTLAFLQLAWSFAVGPSRAVAAVVAKTGVQVKTVNVNGVAFPIATPLKMGGRVNSLANVSLGPVLPRFSVGRLSAVQGRSTVRAVPGARTGGGAASVSRVQAADTVTRGGRAAIPVIRGEAAPSAGIITGKTSLSADSKAATVQSKKVRGFKAVAKRVDKALKLNGLTGKAGVEASKGSAEKLFAALSGRRLINSGAATIKPGAGTFTGRLKERRTRNFLARPGAGPATAEKSAAIENADFKGEAKQPALIARLWRNKSVRWGAALAGGVGLIAAAPLLAANVGWVAATGSVTLSVIGIPQIIKNFKQGHEGVKDLAIASTLIWFAAAVLLSVVSIAQGTSLWWNVANLAGVAEAAVVLGQINYHQKNAKNIKATILTALAVLAPLPLIIWQVFLPLSSWLSIAFAAAMALLWVLNWPQVVKNYRTYKAEGRPPEGIAPLYPALVAGGSMMHLFAAVMGGDVRWAMNGVIAILTAGLVLSQIYMPRATNAAVGPVVRLAEKLHLAPRSRAVEKAKHLGEARGVVAELFQGADYAKFAGRDIDAQLDAVVARGHDLPGRSLIYLEAPTAAGKSTLAKRLEKALGERLAVFPVDRYYKASRDVPRALDGRPDFDHPDSLYLDHAAGHIRDLLAGKPVEMPLHDMETETTRFDSGEYLQLKENEVLVVDSIYASHEKLLDAAAGRETLNIYLHVPAAVRLKRRILRDLAERGKSTTRTLKDWLNILHDEELYILPLRGKADSVINLVGEEELGVLTETYADILTGMWAAEGKTPGNTKLFLDAVRASIRADFNGNSQ